MAEWTELPGMPLDVRNINESCACWTWQLIPCCVKADLIATTWLSWAALEGVSAVRVPIRYKYRLNKGRGASEAALPCEVHGGIRWIPYGALAELADFLFALSRLAVEFHQCRAECGA